MSKFEQNLSITVTCRAISCGYFPLAKKILSNFQKITINKYAWQNINSHGNLKKLVSLIFAKMDALYDGAFHSSKMLLFF